MLLALKLLLYSLLLPATFAIYVPLAIAKERTPASAEAILISVPIFAVGAAIFGWCLWAFAALGQGTPVPIDAPKRLVVRGLYRATRNPLYVGVLSVAWGWAILFQSTRLAIYALLAGVGFHLFVVLYEEPRLRRQFGAEYKRYYEQVGRWLPKWNSPAAASPRESSC